MRQHLAQPRRVERFLQHRQRSGDPVEPGDALGDAQIRLADAGRCTEHDLSDGAM